ncbi:hypothetical protein [Halorussus caseinilyticus]|uniref:Secreted protein n=1 Tax=Halorussus caseinilyticus TaxID=3034025 RepID=A0ABD5WGQ9_9EURY|nr:hypothetical protein [Halorussus sp. DT72]
MTHCYNCGHTGTFVLLVQFALAVPSPAGDHDAESSAATGVGDGTVADSAADADRHATADPRRPASSPGLSLAVQCPACDSTDVGVEASDLLARYRSSTTS